MKIKFLSLLISCLVISGFSGCAVKQEQDLSQKEVVVEKQAPKKVAKKTKKKKQNKQVAKANDEKTNNQTQSSKTPQKSSEEPYKYIVILE